MFKLQKLAGAARAQGELQFFIVFYAKYSNVLNNYLTMITLTYAENFIYFLFI